MAVNVGTLVIDLEAGTSNFTEAMGKAARNAADTAADISHSLHSIAEAGKETVETALVLAGTFKTVAAATTTAATTGDTLVESYRALRLVLSPTLFTATSLALGALAEKTIELTLAQAKLIDQQSVLAATWGYTYAAVERLKNIGGLTGTSVESYGQLNDALKQGTLEEAAEAFARIADPAQRAAKAVELFGKENAALALEELGPHFTEAAEAVDQYGLKMDEVARVQIAHFRDQWQQVKDFFTDFTLEKQWLKNLEDGLVLIGIALDNVLQKASDWFDKLIPVIPALRGAFGGLPALPTAPTTTTDTTNKMLAQDLLAQETGIRQRQALTKEGVEAARDATKAELDAEYKKLSGAKQVSLLESEQLQSLRQRYEALKAQAKAMQDAEDAAKEAARKAEELERWRAGEADRLRTMAEHAVTTPVASAMVRARDFVLQNADKTTPEMREARAAIGTDLIQKAVQEQLRKLGEAWEKEVAAEEARRQKLYEFELSHTIAKDEAVVNAMRNMSSVLASRDISMARIGAQPGDEVATAQKVLDIQLRENDAARNQYLTEAQILELDAQRQRDLSDHDIAVKQHAAELERNAMATGGQYQLQLRMLQEQLNALGQIEVTSKNISDINLAREALEDRILEVQKQQALAIGTLQSGWRAFFIEMQKQAEKPGQILYQGMMSAVDGVSRALSLATTGGKANWGQTFADLGRQMNEQAIRAIMQRSLGVLGQKLGITPKLDGQTPQTAPWVRIADDAGNPIGTATGRTPSPNALGLGPLFGGYQGRGIFNFAGAGGVTIPAQPSTTNNYFDINVDARGTDQQATQTQRIMQAITIAAQTAVATAGRAQTEKQQRTVAGTR